MPTLLIYTSSRTRAYCSDAAIIEWPRIDGQNMVHMIAQFLSF